MRDDQCGTLRVQRGIYDLKGEKTPISISAWKPSPEDLERLNNGGLIYLNVFGNGHPMVSINTEKYEVEPIQVGVGSTTGV